MVVHSRDGSFAESGHCHHRSPKHVIHLQLGRARVRQLARTKPSPCFKNADVFFIFL